MDIMYTLLMQTQALIAYRDTKASASVKPLKQYLVEAHRAMLSATVEAAKQLVAPGDANAKVLIAQAEEELHGKADSAPSAEATK